MPALGPNRRQYGCSLIRLAKRFRNACRNFRQTLEFSGLTAGARVSIVAIQRLLHGPFTVNSFRSIARKPTDQRGRETGAVTLSLVPRAGYFRWVICTLLLFGVTKNYMD